MGRCYIAPLLGLWLVGGCQTREYQLFYKQNNGQLSPEDNGELVPQSEVTTDIEPGITMDPPAAGAIAMPANTTPAESEADDDADGSEETDTGDVPCFGSGEYRGEYTCYIDSVFSYEGEIRFRVGDSSSGELFQTLQSGAIEISWPRPEAAPGEPLMRITLPIDGQAVCQGQFYAVAGDYELEDLPQLDALLAVLAGLNMMRMLFSGSWHGEDGAFWGDLEGKCDGCMPQSFCNGQWSARRTDAEAFD